jgi:truncated hemoglobin YjbI
MDPTKPDITNRHDIEQLLIHFYEKAFNDDIIGYIFTEVMRLDLKAHLPIIASFWEDILLGTNQYYGNPVRVHKHINSLTALNIVHFERWLQLWNQTIDDHYKGPVCDEAKQRAANIAQVMIAKI